MATNTRFFASTDTGAPVLTGQVGSLISLLKACLVGTAGVAYGTGGSAKSAAGWTNAYENIGANKIAFRNSVAAGGTGCYLRVADNGGMTGGAREASCRLYFTMSDVDTGTDPTPTVAQYSDGLIARKSGTTDSTAREWFLAADERTLYLSVKETTRSDTGSTWSTYCCFAAGDYASDDPAQTWACFIAGNRVSVTASLGNSQGYSIANMSSNALNPGLYLMRSVSHTSGPVNAGILGRQISQAGGAENQGSLPNPNTGSGNLYFTPSYIATEPTSSSPVLYGRFRGVFTPLNYMGLEAQGASYSAPPGSEFTTLRLLKQRTNLSSAITGGAVAIETGASW